MSWSRHPGICTENTLDSRTRNVSVPTWIIQGQSLSNRSLQATFRCKGGPSFSCGKIVAQDCHLFRCRANQQQWENEGWPRGREKQGASCAEAAQGLPFKMLWCTSVRLHILNSWRRFGTGNRESWKVHQLVCVVSRSTISKAQKQCGPRKMPCGPRL